MEQLIPVINKLQEVIKITGNDPIDLPQIVVIGSQSSGKSSVLENIVGRDFLPRGKDIVTRRPLILQCINLKLSKSATGSYSSASLFSDEEYAEFGHLPNQKFHNFDKVKIEIETETGRIAGKNKNISKLPIYLKIYSPNMVDLTLVDLPGMTKIPIGDQPQDIEIQIRSLIYEYVSKPNSIILAITPANSDLVNSESLKLAKEVDPEGVRTIGVLTKLDLMDAGTHAFDILCNKSSYRLKLGFIGVVNRSQQDINHNKSITDALKYESDFFKSHPYYRVISSKTGTGYLAKTLNQILMNHIKDRLPELKVKINALIGETSQELASFGEPLLLVTNRENRGSILLSLITKFAKDFNDFIEGTSSRNNYFSSPESLFGGAKINYIFNELFANMINEIDPSAGLSLNDIRCIIRNSTGPRPSLFIPESSFEVLAKKQIQKLEQPGHCCVELVFEELTNIVNSISFKELSRFPNLCKKLINCSSNLLREQLKPTTNAIEMLIKIELSYINTNHPDFIGAGAAIAALGKLFERKKKERQHLGATKVAEPIIPKSTSTPDGGLFNYLFKSSSSNPPPPSQSKHHHIMAKPPSSGSKSEEVLSPESSTTTLAVSLSDISLDDIPSTNSLNGSSSNNPSSFLNEKEEMETHLILSLLSSYFGIVKKNLTDSIPKAVMAFLVNSVKDSLQNFLVSELYREELFSGLLQEDENVEKERSRLKLSLEAYKKAANALSEVVT